MRHGKATENEEKGEIASVLHLHQWILLETSVGTTEKNL